MSLFDRKPALRWLAPLAFVLVVGGTSGVVALNATADPRLAPRSAAELLVDLQQAKIDALSGTVVQESNLGIPELPGRGMNDSSLTSLVSGTHTLRVWYSGPDKARLALLPSLNETDVIRNGPDLWTWSSKDNSATHRTLPVKDTKQGRQPGTDHTPTDMPKTPQEAAEKVLAAVDPTTVVRTDSNVTVAGRGAYELVLQPKDSRALVTEVRVAIDGTEHIPLRVRVFAGSGKPAFEVAFTAVSFERPDDAQFAFNPPAGTTVTEIEPDQSTPDSRGGKVAHQPSSADPTVVGSGWTTVVVTETGPGGVANGELGQLLRSLPKVNGTWGAGRLLAGTAFSVVVTDDGRMAVGSVKPELLYQALEK
jgi:outer membrane lipoprotein-sorting protein